MDKNVQLIRDVFDAFARGDAASIGATPADRTFLMAAGAWSGIARSTGKSFATDWGMVFGVRDGHITSFRVVEDTAQLSAAFHR